MSIKKGSLVTTELSIKDLIRQVAHAALDACESQLTNLDAMKAEDCLPALAVYARNYSRHQLTSRKGALGRTPTPDDTNRLETCVSYLMLVL